MTSFMPEKATVDSLADFIVASYADADLLINCSEIQSSQVFDPEAVFSEVSRNLLLLRENNKLLAVLNTDAFVQAEFSLKGSLGESVILITKNLEDMPSLSNLISYLEGKEETVINRDNLGLKLPGNIHRRELALETLSFPPPLIRPLLQAKGILALRFGGERGIGFFVDLKKIILQQISQILSETD